MKLWESVAESELDERVMIGHWIGWEAMREICGTGRYLVSGLFAGNFFRRAWGAMGIYGTP